MRREGNLDDRHELDLMAKLWLDTSFARTTPMRWTLAACLISLSLPVAGVAHAQATTTCNQFGSSVTCNTTPDPMQQMRQQQQDMDQQQRDLQAFMAQSSTPRAPSQPVRWQDVPPRPCTGLQRYANADNQTCAAREVAANRKAVGDLIAAGQCGEALKGALGTGDLQFAREVRDFCGAK